MKKLIVALIALCIFAVPVMAADELTGLSDQQILAVYDALQTEIQKRNLDTSQLTQRDPIYVFGENVHIQTGQLTNCLPTPMPDNTLLINQNTQSALPPAIPAAVPTATPVVAVGDKAHYEGQYPTDGYHVTKGQVFDITWNLMNTGTTTWTTDYCMRFFNGTDFTKPRKDRFYLNNPVAPNTVGACSVDAVAPSSSGTYYMGMVLSNENDENFMFVDITIVVD